MRGHGWHGLGLPELRCDRRRRRRDRPKRLTSVAPGSTRSPYETSKRCSAWHAVRGPTSWEPWGRKGGIGHGDSWKTWITGERRRRAASAALGRTAHARACGSSSTSASTSPSAEPSQAAASPSAAHRRARRPCRYRPSPARSPSSATRCPAGTSTRRHLHRQGRRYGSQAAHERPRPRWSAVVVAGRQADPLPPSIPKAAVIPETRPCG